MADSDFAVDYDDEDQELVRESAPGQGGEAADEVDFEDFDLYAGLPAVQGLDDVETYPELKERAAGLEIRARQAEALLAKAEKQVALLSAQNTALKRNISCLYKTAKAEVARKDAAVARARQEINQLTGKTAYGPAVDKAARQQQQQHLQQHIQPPLPPQQHVQSQQYLPPQQHMPPLSHFNARAAGPAQHYMPPQYHHFPGSK